MNQDELKVLEERIKANPKSRSFLQLAEAYIEAGRRSEAIELLKNGEDYYPYYLAARITYGRLLREEGEVDKAIEQFEFVNRTIPDNLLALKNLAHLYTSKSRLADARTAANSVLTLSPNDPEIVELLKTITSLENSAPQPEAPAPVAEQKRQPVTAREPEPAELPSDVLKKALEPAQEEVVVTLSEKPSDLPPAPLEETAPEPEPEPEPVLPEELPMEVSLQEPAEEPSAREIVPEKAPGLPETETMGDLLFDQGHAKEALSIYEKALLKDPASLTLPEKIRKVQESLGMGPVEEPFVPEPERAPEPEPVLPPVPEPKVLAAPLPEPEPEAPESVPPTAPLPKPVAVAPAPMPTLSGREPREISPDDSLPERIISMVSGRMNRDLLGYVLSTIEGLSIDSSGSGEWADTLAADGIEIVRIVTDMTRTLNWGEFRGTLVWSDEAILYGIPIEETRVLFLVLKPESNIGLCRLLVQKASRFPAADGVRK